MTVAALNVTAETFAKEVIEASKTMPVLVDFWADWCGPCKQLMPVLERLAVEYAGRFVLAKVNTDDQQALAGQIGVRSLPTVVLFKDGNVADHFVGALPEGQIKQLLDKHLPALKKTPLQEARELNASGDYARAAEILESALIKEPNSIEMQCALAETRVLSGDLDSARATLEKLQSREPNAIPVKRLAALIEFNDVVQSFPDVDALRAKLSADPKDLEARHALAVHRLLALDYDAALEDWLEMMRHHRKYKDDLARKSLVLAFELIGQQDPRVAQTRREMARLLF